MAASQAEWATVINSADDATARLILQYQLDDIKALEDGAADSADADQSAALRYFKAELEHHRALRWSSPSPTPPEQQPATAYSPTRQARETTAPPDNAALEPPPGSFTPLSPFASAPSDEHLEKAVTFPCEACGDRFDADHCWQAPCQHWYCDDDLGQLFRASMTDRALYPPRCCRQPMPFDEVQVFLDPELAQEFAAKKEELDEKLPTYCHAPTCSTYIGQASKDGTKGTCPSCGSETCVLCKQLYHTGDCAEDEALEQMEKLAKEEGWQKCIDCKRLVELTIGCNHMTCLCRAEFCFPCGARWRTCACPQWHEARLLARGQQIADREGRADVAAVVEEVRQNHDCERNHVWEREDGGGDCDECGDYLHRFIFICTRCRMSACRRCMDNVL